MNDTPSSVDVAAHRASVSSMRSARQTSGSPMPEESPRTGFHHIQPLVPSAIGSGPATGEGEVKPRSASGLVRNRSASETAIRARNGASNDSMSETSNGSEAAPTLSTGSISDEEEYLAKYGTKTASGNSRIYNCKQCNRAFTREEHLTRHTLSTHNKLKPFVCGICSRPFSRRDLLLRHAKNLHQGSELAVNRIRKLYKRPKRGEDSDDDDDDDSQAEENTTIDDQLEYKKTSVEPGEGEELASFSTPLPIDAKPYNTPDKKRMKMSVNMLVS